MSDNDEQLLENIIMKFLYTDSVVRDKVLPYFRFSLFDNTENVEIIKFIKKFMIKYEKFPNLKETRLKFKNAEAYNHLREVLKIDITEYSQEVILGEIQEYIKQKSLMDVCYKVAERVSNDDMSEIMSAPDEMREALAFSFDDNVGLDIFDESSEDRMYDHLHNTDYVVSTGLDTIDDLIEGGFHEKTLTLIMAETNMGKSLMMGALAKNNAFQGKKVLYVTCEMSEFKIGERILANSLDINTKDIKMLTRDKFSECLKKARANLAGKFVVKEYPTGVATISHIRNLVKELQIKKNFTPDIIYIDYISIMASILNSKSDNTYTLQKRITEEVRRLAVELGIPIVSAIQTNRMGMGKDELDLTNTSDSIGTAFTADIIIAVTQSEELRAMSKFMWSLIKNRYGQNKVGVTIKVDYPKMRLSDDEICNDGNGETTHKPNRPQNNSHQKPNQVRNAPSSSESAPKNRKIIRKESDSSKPKIEF